MTTPWRDHGFCYKRSYPDKLTADLAVARIQGRATGVAPRPRSSYFCGDCRRWHLTRRPAA